MFTGTGFCKRSKPASEQSGAADACFVLFPQLILQPLRDSVQVSKQPIVSAADLDRLFPPSISLHSFLALSQALFFELLQLQERVEREEDLSAVAQVRTANGVERETVSVASSSLQ